ncbi:MAG TPA: hypothetical protein VN948_10925 [Terriglobales bacterium]|nr:hypothetical protein [Terriglobales bacterium]
MLAACLVLLPNAYQERAQEDPQQSVAEAANSARQRQKSTILGRVLNNEDAPSKVAADDHPISDQQES